jgi:hypothetical protein
LFGVFVLLDNVALFGVANFTIPKKPFLCTHLCRWGHEAVRELKAVRGLASQSVDARKFITFAGRDLWAVGNFAVTFSI